MARIIAAGTSAAPFPKNVLLIQVDDLRSELNCVGRSKVKTPHIDKLAERAVAFTPG